MSQPPPTDGPQSLARLLLAEDNPTNQLVAMGMLRKLGYTDITVVPDGQQAVDQALAARFDAILMDCQMPGTDGYQATQMLRAQGCDTPIIAMTANAADSDRERCIAAGMDDYLAKPIAREALGEMLARWTRVKSSQASLAPSAGLSAEPSAGDAVFNRAALAEHFGGDEELLAVAVKSFLEHTPKLIDGLRAAIAAGQQYEIVRLAHSAHGSCAMMCAPALQSAASAIEQLGREGKLDGLTPLLQRLEAGFADFRRDAGV